MTLMTRNRSLLPTLPTIFDNMFEDADGFGTIFASRDVLPAVNVLENDKWYEFDFAVPGLDKKDFHVWTDNGQLIVTVEKTREDKEEDEHFVRKEFNYTEFRRAFTLPSDVNQKEIKARYDSGVLRIRIGRAESKGKVEPKRVTIQ